jgi:hypothetical protein
MHTTNYSATLIEVAPDTKATEPTEPPNNKPTVAALQYEMLFGHDYELTSDDVIFGVHAIRNGIAEEDLVAARAEFFSKGQACLRTSPLAKTYGWGFHFDDEGKVALIPMGSTQYDALRSDPEVTKTRAMRSSRKP